jgi:hypothetical protein
MSPLRLTLAFFIALAVAIVARAPMTAGLALAGLGDALAAREAHGTVWSGRLVKASLGSTPLGDVRARLSPGRLLTGRPVIDITARGGAIDGRGRLLLGGSPGVEDFTGSIPLEQLGAPAPFGGTLVLKSAGFAFSKGACRRVAGQASAEVRGLGDTPMTLTGRPECRGRAMVLPLSGERDGVRVDVSLRLEPSGGYATETRVATADAALGEMLLAAGFARTGDGYLKINKGRLA